MNNQGEDVSHSNTSSSRSFQEWDEEHVGQLYTAGQALVATVNSPHKSKTTSLLRNLYENVTSTSRLAKDSTSTTLTTLVPVTKHDFKTFLDQFGQTLAIYARHRHRKNSIHVESNPWYQGQGLVESMRQVPAEFFREDYFVGDLDTYNRICPGPDCEETWVEVVQQLSNYVDVIEINLLQEIEGRADAFFDAMDFIQHMQRSIMEACSSILEVRGVLKHHKINSIEGISRIKELQNEKQALETLLNFATQLDTIHAAKSTLEMLLPSSDYASILDVMDTIQYTLASSDVKVLSCFSEMSAYIIERKEELIQNMSNEFIVGAKALTKNYAALSEGEVLSPYSRYGQLEQYTGIYFLPVVLNLHRTGCLTDGLNKLSSDLERECKAEVFQKTLDLIGSMSKNNGLDEHEVEEGSNLEEDIKEKVNSLTLNDFLRIQEGVISVMTEKLNNANNLQKAMESILKESFFMYSQDFHVMQQNLNDTISSRWTKILQMRSKIHSKYKLPEFLNLVQQTFALLGNNSGLARNHQIQNAIQNQGKAFLDSLQQYCKTKVISSLEQDQWIICQISPHIECMIQNIQNEKENCVLPDENESKGDDRAFTVIDDKHIYLVPSTLMFVNIVNELLSLRALMPLLTTEVTHRIIELFKIYNSMSCNLILGAGAIKSAGLKSISVKHLAALAQSITFLRYILPFVIDKLQQTLLPLHLDIFLSQVSSLKLDLDEHHKQIEQKIIRIMEDRLYANLKVLESISETWNESKEDEVLPSQFARTVVKQIEVLNKTLSSILLQEELDVIFGQICSVFSNSITVKCKSLTQGDQHWHQHLLCDVNAIFAKLQDLPVTSHIKEASLESIRDFCREADTSVETAFVE